MSVIYVEICRVRPRGCFYAAETWTLKAGDTMHSRDTSYNTVWSGIREFNDRDGQTSRETERPR